MRPTTKLAENQIKAELSTKPTSAKRQPPTPEQILAQQKAQAAREREEREKAAKANTAMVPAKAVGTAVAAPDNRTNVQRYLDDIAPASIVGRLVKFSKEGAFVTGDDGEAISQDADFIALCDQTLIGWIKFNDDETPPDRVQGLLYDNFKMPDRASLGDTSEAEWPLGLSGMPEDPWQHQICLVLQNTATRELYTYATSSKTGRRAVGNLLRHFERMQQTNPGELPVVRLKSGGFHHKDERIGWVATPSFSVVGRAPRDSAAKPDTSVSADLNDEIPF